MIPAPAAVALPGIAASTSTTSAPSEAASNAHDAPTMPDPTTMSRTGILLSMTTAPAGQPAEQLADALQPLRGRRIAFPHHAASMPAGRPRPPAGKEAALRRAGRRRR